MLRVSSLTFVLAAWPTLVAAQAVVTGRVTGAGRLLANAELSTGADLRTLTTDSGTYRLVLTKGGVVQVSVRAVGFHPTFRRLDLAANDTAVVDFALATIPQVLDSITVAANAVPISPKMRGFEERRGAGFGGYFYTREALAKRESSILSNVIRVAGVQLVRRPSHWGGGHAVATGRGGADARTPCYAAIFLDGVAYWGPGWGPPPNIDELKVTDLEGIEVYRSALEAPLLFQRFRSECGVVVLWTRVGGSR